MDFSNNKLILIWILLVLFLQTGRTIGQSYNKLLSENKSWDIYNWESGYIVQYTTGQRQNISGDTIINGQTYKIVLGNEIISDEPVFVEPFSLSGNIFPSGFIREDTLSKKIYTWSINQGKEFLTYDFGLASGDSLYVGYLGGNYIYLDSITKAILETGEERRQFNFSGAWMLESNNSYIEGIGGESSMLYPFDYSFEFGSDLTCVKEQGQIIYGLSNCDILSGSNEVVSNDIILIYPNPTSSSISFDLGGRNINKIEILDLNGSMLMNVFVEDKIESLDLEKLPIGVYFISFKFESNQYYISKFIKN